MIGDNLFFLNSVDSTNNYAMGRVHAGLAKHGDIYLAREQTSGKGQRGKGWQTDPGQNITLSITLETKELFFASQFLLSAAIALAAAELFKEKVTDAVTIKWPNDIYWRDRKAGGILIENLLQGVEWKWAIAGIGLNVNQTAFPPGLSNAVSMKQITGKEWNIESLAKELSASIETRWQQLFQGNAQDILEEYNRQLYKKGEKVKLRKSNINFETVITEVTSEGELVTEDSIVHRFRSGEIQWVI